VLGFGLNTFASGEKIGEYALKLCPGGIAVLHAPPTYGQGGLYRIQLAYDKAGKKIGIDHTITENWSTGATTGLMPEVNAAKAAGFKCIDRWPTPEDQVAFVQDLHSASYKAWLVYDGNRDHGCMKRLGSWARMHEVAIWAARPFLFLVTEQ
jgi:branched-chain amino acid transport system substrate-binding protein